VILAYQMDLPRDKDYMVHLHVGDPEGIRLVRGDITQYPADAIVNAANSELLPGGGVCGAIHRAGGPAIADECARIRSERGPLSPGQAVATTAGRLGAKYVIHALGPVWHGGDQGEPEALSNCYRESMRIADELGLHSIAFPAISTGIFGYPVDQAAWVAIPSLIESLRPAKHLVFVSVLLFDKNALDAFASAALSQRQPASGNPYKVALGIMNE
jgi:O-acetyl-ADP-ribose deacetylase (regulator of RNase III)